MTLRSTSRSPTEGPIESPPTAAAATPEGVDAMSASQRGGMTGYFTDGSMLRQVVGEYAVALSGPRALLMMAAHPVAFAGFFAHTGALEDPNERLRRTGQV